MTTMIIGSFEKPGGGDALVDDLNTAEGLGAGTAIAHGAHLREEEIQLPGTLSFAYGIAGALLVGTVGTLIAWLVVWPTLGVSLPLGALGGFVAANATPAAQAVYEERRRIFAERRDYLLPALRGLGFDIPVVPQGAFYLYAGCQRFTDDSFAFCRDLLEQAAVAITPGIDFGTHRANAHVRFAYTTPLEQLQEGVARLRGYLEKFL